MAGKNQHHIWRMMQRGFGEKRGKDHHCWIYEREDAPRKTGTRKYGAEDWFFSEGSDHSADDVLTNFENEMQSFIQDARSAAHGQPLDSEPFGRLVAHFEVRSQFMRSEISRLSERIAVAVEELFGSKRRLESLILRKLKTKPDLIVEEMKKAGIPPELEPTVRSYIDVFGEELDFFEASQARIFVDQFVTALSFQKEAFAKATHIKAVGAGFDENERIAGHQRMNYSVRRTNSDLILPDTCLAFFKRNGLSPITSKSDAVEAVVIPVESRCCVVGSVRGEFVRDERTICKALASCSFKSFLARKNDPDFRKLTKYIGKSARLVSDQELERALDPEKLMKEL